MADGIKISELPEIETLQDGNCFPVISEIEGIMQNVKIKKVNLEKTLASNVFSTEETVCGKWIDGKTVYRKVYTHEVTGTNISSQTIILDRSIHPDNARLINCYGYHYSVSKDIITSTDVKYCEINSSAANLFDEEKAFGTKGLRVYVAKPEGTSVSKYCWIIEYIKL